MDKCQIFQTCGLLDCMLIARGTGSEVKLFRNYSGDSHGAQRNAAKYT